MTLKIKTIKYFHGNAFYKALELMVSENMQNPVLSVMLDLERRQGFRSVYPEIQIIKGQIIEVLLYLYQHNASLI